MPMPLKKGEEEKAERKKEVGRQHQKMGRPGIRQVPEGGEEQTEMEETGCGVNCGARATPVIKG